MLNNTSSLFAINGEQRINIESQEVQKDNKTTNIIKGVANIEYETKLGKTKEWVDAINGFSKSQSNAEKIFKENRSIDNKYRASIRGSLSYIISALNDIRPDKSKPQEKRENISIGKISNSEAVLNFINGISNTFSNIGSTITLKKANNYNKILSVFINGISSSISLLSESSKGMNQSKFEGIVSFLDWTYNTLGDKDEDFESKGIFKFFKKKSSYKVTVKDAKNLGLILYTFAEGISKAISYLNTVSITAKKVENISDVLGFSREFLESIFKIKGLTVQKSKAISISLQNIVNSVSYAIPKLSSVNLDEYKIISMANSISVISKSLSDIPISIIIRTKVFSSSISTIIKALDKTQKTKSSASFIKSINGIFNAFSSKKAKTATNNIKAFASGIALLGVSLAAFAIITPLVLVASLGIKAFSWAIRGMTSKKQLTQLALFTASFALFGVAIWAFGEVVTGESMLKTVGGLVILYGVLQLFGGNGFKFGKYSLPGTKKGVWKDVAMAAASIAILGLGIHYGWGQVSLSECLVAATGVAGLGLAVQVWTKIKGSEKGSASMLIAALGVGALGLGMQAWKNVDMGTMMTALIGSAGMAGVLYLLSMAGPMALIGAGALILAGAGVAALGFGVSLFPNDGEFLLKVGIFTAALLGAVTLVGAAGPLALIGAGTLLIMGAGVAALGIGLGIAAKAGVTEDTINIVGMGIVGIAKAFGSNVFTIMKGAIGAAAFLPIAASMLLITPTLKFFSWFNIDKNKVQNNVDALGIFVTSITSLMDKNKKKMLSAYLGIKALSGLGNLMKTLAEGVDAIGNLQFNEYTVKNGKLVLTSTRKFEPSDFKRVGDSLGLIIDALSSPLEQVGSKKATVIINGKTYTNPFGSNLVKEGIDSLKNIGQIIYPIAQGVKMIGVDLKDPKIYSDFGEGIGKIITALSEPFIQIGKKEAKVTIFGKTFTNPFGSNDVKKGIDSFKELGGFLTPIIEGIKAFGEENIDKKVDMFTKFIPVIMGTIADAMERYSSIDSDDISMEWFNTLAEAINSVNIKNLSEFESKIINIARYMNTSSIWNKADSNLKKIGQNLKLIKEQLNGIDLKKIVLFDNVIKNLKSISDKGDLLKLCDAILELIDKIELKSSSVSNTSYQNNFQPNFVTPGAQNTPTNTIQKNNSNTESKLEELISRLADSIDNGSNKNNIKNALMEFFDSRPNGIPVNVKNDIKLAKY